MPLPMEISRIAHNSRRRSRNSLRRKTHYSFCGICSFALPLRCSNPVPPDHSSTRTDGRPAGWPASQSVSQRAQLLIKEASSRPLFSFIPSASSLALPSLPLDDSLALALTLRYGCSVGLISIYHLVHIFAPINPAALARSFVHSFVEQSLQWTTVGATGDSGAAAAAVAALIFAPVVVVVDPFVRLLVQQ